MPRLLRVVAALTATSLFLTACTDDNDSAQADVDPIASRMPFGSAPADATTTDRDDQYLAPVETEPEDRDLLGDDPEDLTVLVGDGAAELGDVIETGARKSADTAGLAQVLDGNRLVAAAVLIDSPLRDRSVPTTIGAESTADALVLSTPGLATPSPLWAELTLAVLAELPERAVLVEAIREASANDPDFTLDDMPTSVIAATADAVTATLTALDAAFAEVGPAGDETTDTQALGDAVAYVGAMTEPQMDTQRAASCDDTTVLLPVRGGDREVDNVCVVQTGFDHLAGTGTFSFTNRATRWVTLHLDDAREPAIFVPPAGVPPIAVSSAAGYGFRDQVLDQRGAERYVDIIADLLTLESNDRVADHMNRVRDSLFLLRRETPPSTATLPLGDISTITTRAHGFPASPEWRDTFCDDFSDQPAAYYDAQMFNIATQTLVPAVLFMFDGIQTITGRLKKALSARGDVEQAYLNALGAFDSSNFRERLFEEYRTPFVKKMLSSDVGQDPNRYVSLYHESIRSLVDEHQDALSRLFPRTACIAGQTGGDNAVTVTEVHAAAGAITATSLSLLMAERKMDTLLYIVRDIWSAAQQLAGLAVTDPAAVITSADLRTAAGDAAGEALIGLMPWTLGVNAHLASESMKAQYGAVVESAWRYEPFALYAVTIPTPVDLTTFDWTSVEWPGCVDGSEVAVDWTAVTWDEQDGPMLEGGSVDDYETGVITVNPDDATFGDLTGDGVDDAVFRGWCGSGNTVSGRVWGWTTEGVAPGENPRALPPLTNFNRYSGFLSAPPRIEDGVLIVETSEPRDGDGQPWLESNGYPVKVTTAWRVVDVVGLTGDVVWEAEELSRDVPPEPVTPAEAGGWPGLEFDLPSDVTWNQWDVTSFESPVGWNWRSDGDAGSTYGFLKVALHRGDVESYVETLRANPDYQYGYIEEDEEPSSMDGFEGRTFELFAGGDTIVVQSVFQIASNRVLTIDTGGGFIGDGGPDPYPEEFNHGNVLRTMTVDVDRLLTETGWGRG